MSGKQLITTYSECTPDEIGKAVYHAAIRAFLDGRPRTITLKDLLDQRTQFTPANIANPEQISAIRRASRHAMSAASDDNSEFRIRPVASFEKLMEG